MTQHERSKVLLPPMAMHAETTPCVVRGEGCYLYTEDGRKILDMLANGHTSLKPMITERYPFDQAIEAFAAVKAHNDRRVKIMIDFD